MTSWWTVGKNPSYDRSVYIMAQDTQVLQLRFHKTTMNVIVQPIPSPTECHTYFCEGHLIWTLQSAVLSMDRPRGTPELSWLE